MDSPFVQVRDHQQVDAADEPGVHHDEAKPVALNGVDGHLSQDLHGRAYVQDVRVVLEDVFLLEQQVVDLVCEIVADLPHLVVEVDVPVIQSVKTSAKPED